MPPTLQRNAETLALADRILARADGHHHTVQSDLAFLAAWDKGLPPSPSSILRVRQLRRANQADATTGNESSTAPPGPNIGAAWQS